MTPPRVVLKVFLPHHGLQGLCLFLLEVSCGRSDHTRILASGLRVFGTTVCAGELCFFVVLKSMLEA